MTPPPSGMRRSTERWTVTNECHHEHACHENYFVGRYIVLEIIGIKDITAILRPFRATDIMII